MLGGGRRFVTREGQYQCFTSMYRTYNDPRHTPWGERCLADSGRSKEWETAEGSTVGHGLARWARWWAPCGGGHDRVQCGVGYSPSRAAQYETTEECWGGTTRRGPVVGWGIAATCRGPGGKNTNAQWAHEGVRSVLASGTPPRREGGSRGESAPMADVDLA